MNERISNFLFDIYEQGKAILEGVSGEAVCHKSANDLLTKADLALNDFFTRAIQTAFPEAKIIAEESENGTLGDELTFVVDPLDGTCNFSRGVKLHGIQIAVMENKECVASLVGLPRLDLVYYAEKGKGCYRNGERIRIDANISHEDGILSLSDFYHDEDDIEFDDQFKLVAALQGDFLKTRLFGAACYDFAALAEGQSQAYLCYYRHIWDIAPGLLLAKEAGAVYARLNGSEYHYGDESIVVANNEETLNLVLTKAKPFLRGA